MIRNKRKKWLDEWIVSKNEHFFYCGIHSLLKKWKKWEKIVASNGKYFE